MEKNDLDSLKQEIRTFHQDLIQAHFDKDLDFFINDIGDDYFSVSRGEIRHPSREDILSQFSAYLGRTEFKDYRDLEEPLIGISDDGSLGWSLVRVKVAGDQEQSDGTQAKLDFICAWITLFKREGDRWIRLGEVSSFPSS